MRKERIKKIFTDAASDVADQFYPKGHERRGEFIRDAAVLYTKLDESLTRYVKDKKKKPIALHTMLIVQAVLEEFDERGGFYSNDAYCELIEMTEGLLLGTVKKIDYVRHLEFIFGFDGTEHVTSIQQTGDMMYKHYREHGHLEFSDGELPEELSKVIAEKVKDLNDGKK